MFRKEYHSPVGKIGSCLHFVLSFMVYRNLGDIHTTEAIILDPRKVEFQRDFLMKHGSVLFLLASLGFQLMPTVVEPSESFTTSRAQETNVQEDAGVWRSASIHAGAAAESYLDSAATLLEQGKTEEAARHLEQYVNLRPEHLVVRAQLAELLFRLERFDDSRIQFELFIAMAQEHPEQAFRYLIHCHSRLVEIAEEQEDDYQEYLNRGIGLYLLACRRLQEPEPDGDCSATSLFFRAASELQKARQEQGEEARPHLYLYHIWSYLGQRTAAVRALIQADDYSPLTRLTPSERRDLHVASLREKNLMGEKSR
jgi:tetratricopeptide (TPR) repeat protein